MGKTKKNKQDFFLRRILKLIKEKQKINFKKFKKLEKEYIPTHMFWQTCTAEDFHSLCEAIQIWKHIKKIKIYQYPWKSYFNQWSVSIIIERSIFSKKILFDLYSDSYDIRAILDEKFNIISTSRPKKEKYFVKKVKQDKYALNFTQEVEKSLALSKKESIMVQIMLVKYLEIKILSEL